MKVFISIIKFYNIHSILITNSSTIKEELNQNKRSQCNKQYVFKYIHVL